MPGMLLLRKRVAVPAVDDLDLIGSRPALELSETLSADFLLCSEVPVLVPRAIRALEVRASRTVESRSTKSRPMKEERTAMGTAPLLKVVMSFGAPAVFKPLDHLKPQT